MTPSSFSLEVQVGSDGTVTVVLPESFADKKLLLTFQEVDKNGWPIGFFEATYGAFRDTPIERGEQGQYEERDEIL